MPVNQKYLATFDFEKVYHIYNKTNNKELLFCTAENHRYFLQQYLLYISPIADTYSWSLLPNHFHFIIKIKQQEKICEHLGNRDKYIKAQLESTKFYYTFCGAIEDDE